MPVDVAYSVAGFERIEVDINSLSDFASALRREVEVNLKPCLDRIGKTLDRPYFGNEPVLDLGDKRTTYDDYMSQTKIFLQNIMMGTVQLAQAADNIAASYREADQFAQIKAEDVTSVLPAIPAPPPSGPNRPI
jgi:hypothetical protein